MIDTMNPAEEQSFRADGGGTASRLVGPYLLRRELGRGGMSVVYEARDTRTGGEAALKLLSVPPTFAAEEADRLVARFEREARTMARLSHPNVIEVYEVGAAEGRHFLAMEYLRGETLRERLKQSKLTLGEAYAILTQVASAMDAVHAAGIIHRDIKAANVMLLPDGTARLLDFGIARSSEEATITSADAVIGTPAYMAPEQVRGGAASAATDLWSLGVLAYEMFAGHAPFGGPIVANVLFQVTSRPPAPAPHLPKALGKALRRALDKDPARRYPTAAALVQAIKSALPKSVLPPSPGRGPLPAALPAWPPAALPAATRWAQGTALLLLFAGAFSAAAHEWRPMPRRAALPSAPISSPAAALPVPVVLAPAARPAVQDAAPYWVQTEKPPTAAPGADPSDRDAPDPKNTAQGRQSLPVQTGPEGDTPDHDQPDTRTAAQGSPSRPAYSSEEAAAPQPSPVGYPHPASGRQSSESPAQMSVQPAGPDQSAGQSPYQTPVQYQSPAQAAPQAAVLPDSAGGGYDPEAEARLRKRGWSQGGDTSGQ